MNRSGKKSAPRRFFQNPASSTATYGFTLPDLLVLVATVLVLGSVVAASVQHSAPLAGSAVCQNNLRRLTSGLNAWAIENNDELLSSDAIARRTLWVSGSLSYDTSNQSAWNTNTDLVKSPLWDFVARSAAPFRCPADSSSVQISDKWWPRVRSYALNQALGTGAWLNKTYQPNQTVWRTYSRLSDVVTPKKTYAFIDVHPDGSNDGAFKNACTGAQPGDAPGAAGIIDFPASYHEDGANLSFLDGRVESHRWTGTKIRPPVVYANSLALNVSAGDSALDVAWLAAYTTVKR